MAAEEERSMVSNEKNIEHQRQRATTTRSPSLSPSGENPTTTTVSMAMNTKHYDEESNSGGDHSLEDNDVSLSMRNSAKRVTSLVTAPHPIANIKKQFCIENILADKISSLHRRQHSSFPSPSPNSFIRQTPYNHYRHHHQEGVSPTTTTTTTDNNNKDYNEPIIISTHFCEQEAHPSVLSPPPNLLTLVKNK